VSEQPKKRLFQFSLATAVVLMFVAAGLLWANLLEHENPGCLLDQKLEWGRVSSERVNTDYILGGGPRGWPFVYLQYVYAGGQRGGLSAWKEWHLLCLALDVLLAFAVLLTTAVVCEHLIRRKERQ
jgi:hypothetical protein